MTEPVPSPPTDADVPSPACVEAVAALHILALRRQFVAIRQIFGTDPPHRSREALWAGLEVLLAELRGERITLRDLVVRADGVLSAPTLSRVVAGLERDGLLTSEPALGEGRLKVLRPTRRAQALLGARAEAAFAEFARIVRAAEGSADGTLRANAQRGGTGEPGSQ
jgi:hypothetical protein